MPDVGNDGIVGVKNSGLQGYFLVGQDRRDGIAPSVKMTREMIAPNPIANGYSRLGCFISVTCTACTSTPANSNTIPARNATVPKPWIDGQ